MTDLEYALSKIRYTSKLSCDIKDKAIILSKTIDVYADMLDSVYASLKNEKEKRDNPWIPVTERLPNTDEDVLVTMDYVDGDGKRYLNKDYYKDGSWHSDSDWRIIAWMPLPKVYDGNEYDNKIKSSLKSSEN